jgi:hypothetical protein
MVSRVVFAIIFTFIIFPSILLLAQPVPYDTSIQRDARQRMVISANEIGQYNWGNCYSRFPRDLRVYETNSFGTTPWAVFSGGVKVGSSWRDD